MDEKELRYTVEHKILPKELFENPIKFIIALLKEKGDVISYIYREISSAEDVECIYTPMDFSVDMLPFNNNKCRLFIIHMPKAVDNLQCREVCIVFYEEDLSARYITVEKGIAFNDEFECRDTYHICEWTKDGKHINFGTADSVDEISSMIGRIISGNEGN